MDEWVILGEEIDVQNATSEVIIDWKCINHEPGDVTVYIYVQTGCKAGHVRGSKRANRSCIAFEMLGLKQSVESLDGA